jgi:hypothetical protein
MIHPPLLALHALVVIQPFADLQAATDPTRAVVCLIAAWNAHDASAARWCYAEGAVAVTGGGTRPIDWVAETGYRAFDAATDAVFRFEILAVKGDTVDMEMEEENAFLRALQIPKVTARWRYVVEGGRIAEERHLVADPTFATTFRQFRVWAQAHRSADWSAISDPDGRARFDGVTGDRLVALATEWRPSSIAPR